MNKDRIRNTHIDDVSNHRKYLSVFEEPEEENIEDVQDDITEDIRKVSIGHNQDETNHVATLDDLTIDNKIFPVYIMFNDAHTMVSKSIRLLTRSKYSHVSMSTKGLSEFISFGNTDKNNGLLFESFWEMLDLRKPQRIKIVAVMMNESSYREIQGMLVRYTAKISDLKYSYKDVMSLPFLKKCPKLVGGDKRDFICSQFIAWILTFIKNSEGVIHFDKIDDILVTPGKLNDMISNRTHMIFEGKLDNFKPSMIDEFEKGLNMIDKRKVIMKDIINNVKTVDMISESLFHIDDIDDSIFSRYNLEVKKMNNVKIDVNGIKYMTSDELVDTLGELLESGKHIDEYRMYADIIMQYI
ncbi:MAG: hypothetical protein ACRCZ9_12175 [Fusobacteriaceae bacterium]